MFGKKRIRRIQARYGKDPGTRYEEEDLREIRAYADSRIQADPALFALDEITWADLSMDTVFERICGTDSAAGEQVLYAWLRCPAMEAAEYGRRRALIRAVEADPDLRLKLQLILSKIGKSRAARTAETFAPGAHGKRRLAAALLLSGGLAAAGLGLMLTPACLPVFVALLCLNPLYHIAMVRRLDAHLPAVNSSVALAAAFQRILALGDPGLSACLRPYEAAGRQTHRLARMGGVSFTANHEVMQLLNGLFLFDLILYEWLKVRLYGRREAVSAIHEAVGSVDAAIAVASYRAGAGTVCDPELRFGREEPPRLSAVELVHPLLRRPVGNTLELDGPLLLTGSNASGKSTLLKAAVLAAVMAQGICTAPCSAYSATAFRLYTSMAVSDELLSGDSYFVTELKAFRRILEAAGRGERVLCAVDEVLRGTNTVERIAASSVLLEALAGSGALCLAATHDGELCTLLEASYTLAHFEETLTQDGMVFDYRLRPGAAHTRNAIRLLTILGFDPGLSGRAKARADEYGRTGQWRDVPEGS